MLLVLRGRQISSEDLEVVRSLILSDGHRGRSYLSRELCRHWNWKQIDGTPKDSACRALLLGLEDRGLIKLPRARGGVAHGSRRPRPAPQAELPLAAEAEPLSSFPARTEWSPALEGEAFFLYKDLLDNHHYLGYRRAIGHHLRYIAYTQQRPIGAIAWIAAAQKVAAREQFIGWNNAQRLKNLHLVVNNTRFLVLPRVPHLASHLLASNIRRLAQDWQARYGYAPVLLETFVDTTRFKGTCYKAANWIFVGLTQGRGKYDRHTRRPETVKAVFVYPLRPDFRQVLCNG